MLLGAPPNWSGCLNYLGYHNLLSSALAGAPVASSGDAQLALDWFPYTRWQPTNRGDKSFEVDLDWDAENLALRSQEFDTTWGGLGLKAFGAGSTANAAVAPDGTTTADLITEDTSTGNHQISQEIKFAPNKTYTISIWVKPAGRTSVELIITRLNGSNASAIYGLSGTGSVSSVTNAVSANITQAPNGYYLCELILTSATGSSTNTHRIRLNNGSSGSYTGDGVSGVYLWGYQTTKTALRIPYTVTSSTAVVAPDDRSDPVTTPELYRADYAGLYAYALGGGRVYVEYWNPDTFAYVSLLSFTADELDGSPVMKLASVAAASYRWRVRLVGVPENAVIWSEDYSQSKWVKTGVTVTTNATVAPDGTTTADKIAETAVTSVHEIDEGFSPNLATAGFSVYLKAAERTFATVSIRGSGIRATVRVDLATGTITDEEFTASTKVATSIESVGDGWYRVFVGATTTLFSGLKISSDVDGTIDSNGPDSYLGVAGSGIYAWGAQLTSDASGPVEYRMSGSAAAVPDTADLGVVSVGQWLGVPMQDVGWTPPRLASRDEILTSESDAGQFLGRSVIAQAAEFEIAASFLPADWAYEAWDEFLDHAKRRPFFFFWDIGDGVSDAVFCWVEDKIDPVEFVGQHNVDASIPVRGIV